MYTTVISLSRKRYTSQKSWGDPSQPAIGQKSKTNKGYAPVVSNHKNGIFLLSQGIFTDHFPYTIASSQFAAPHTVHFLPHLTYLFSGQHRHPEKLSTEMSLLHDNRRSSKTGYSLQISLLLELDNSLIIDGGVFYKECITFNSYAQSLTSTFMLLFHKLTQLLLQSSHSHYNTILYTQ